MSLSLLVGDLPVSITRYRVEGNSLTIDRFGVLPEYRNRKIAYAMLHHIVSHIHLQVTNLSFAVAENGWIASKLLKCHFSPNSTATLPLMTLTLQNSGQVQDLISFLQSKLQ